MRPVTTMFSCILILLGMMLFQSTDAAKDIFTIRNSGGNNFGTRIISTEDFIQVLRDGNNLANTLAKRVPLQQDFVYFGSRSKQPKSIYVSNKYFISLWPDQFVQIKFVIVSVWTQAAPPLLKRFWWQLNLIWQVVLGGNV